MDDVEIVHAPYRNLLAGLSGVIFEADAETLQVTYVSPEAEGMLGYPLERWFDEPHLWLEQVVHEEDRQGVIDAVRRLVQAKRIGDVQYRAVRADGVVIWLRSTLQPTHDQYGRVRHVHGCMMTITEEQGAQAALRRSEERLHLALNAATMGVWDWDVATSEIYWSDQVYGLHGFSKEEFDGSYESFMGIVDRVFPDDADYAQDIIRKALVTGDDYGIEYRIHHPDGGVRWLLAKGCIYFDEAGNPERIAGTVQDITSRKRIEAALRGLTETLEQRVRERTAELERANTMLKAEVRERRRAERILERTNTALLQSNHELQNFAYVASHDLQEPLRRILTFADLLRSDCEAQLNVPATSYIERMQTAAERMMHLIRALLEFSHVRTRAQPFDEIDLSEVVRTVLTDLEVRIKETQGRIEVGTLPTIEADPLQMRQLFQNLIGNALKFHRRDVPPVVSLHAEVEPGAGPDGDLCRITVEDNGIGFDEKYLDRIFLPFQRLHGRSEYDGSGMGLAICHRIVERHRGTLSARSTPGEGSTFLITIPVHQAEHEEDLDDLSGY